MQVNIEFVDSFFSVKSYCRISQIPVLAKCPLTIVRSRLSADEHQLVVKTCMRLVVYITKI